jgi:hypothetical protein
VNSKGRVFVKEEEGGGGGWCLLRGSGTFPSILVPRILVV